MEDKDYLVFQFEKELLCKEFQLGMDLFIEACRSEALERSLGSAPFLRHPGDLATCHY